MANKLRQSDGRKARSIEGLRENWTETTTEDARDTGKNVEREKSDADSGDSGDWEDENSETDWNSYYPESA